MIILTEKNLNTSIPTLQDNFYDKYEVTFLILVDSTAFWSWYEYIYIYIYILRLPPSSNQNNEPEPANLAQRKNSW